MDPKRAARMAEELTGRKIGGWTVNGLINNGKSAVVLRAERDGQTVALKLFDPELVERFGDDVQLARIGREAGIVGKEHPNLVRILDGGQCDDTGHVYLVMGMLNEPNLADVIESVPRESIRALIDQVASAARYLESVGIAHRDIKTANICVSLDFSRACLLDLGVLRPIGDSDVTDGTDERPFVGTRRYAPPEFLFRREEDSELGWRAVTFYQLGGVLHDLIMRRPLFHEHSVTDTRIIEAVKSQTPVVRAEDVDEDLVLLARNCLVKEPHERLRLVSWDSFSSERRSTLTSADRRARIMARQSRAPAAGPASSCSTPRSLKTAQAEVARSLKSECTHAAVLPPHRMQTPPASGSVAEVLIEFDPSASHRLPWGLVVHVRLTVESDSDVIRLDGAAIDSDAAGAAPEHAWTLIGHANLDSLPASALADFLYEAVDVATERVDRGDSQSGGWIVFSRG